MLTPQDKDQLAKKGISEAQIADQLASIEKGFPYLKLEAAASIGKGIIAGCAVQRQAMTIGSLQIIAFSLRNQFPGNIAFDGAFKLLSQKNAMIVLGGCGGGHRISELASGHPRQ